MNRTDQQEILKQLESIASLDALYEGEDGRETLLQIHPSFLKLWEIATRPRFSEGDKTNLKNASSVSWEELLSMIIEVDYILASTDQDLDKAPYKKLFRLFTEEKERRLLAYLPKDNQ